MIYEANFSCVSHVASGLQLHITPNSLPGAESFDPGRIITLT